MATQGFRLRPLGTLFGCGVYEGEAVHPSDQGVQLVESKAPSLSPGITRGRPWGHTISESGTPTSPHANLRLEEGARHAAHAWA